MLRRPLAIDICAQLGRKIRELRKAKGWRQIDLAQHSGVHEVHISDLERGSREAGILTLHRIAKSLQTTMSGFVQRARLNSDPARCRHKHTASSRTFEPGGPRVLGALSYSCASGAGVELFCPSDERDPPLVVGTGKGIWSELLPRRLSPNQLKRRRNVRNQETHRTLRTLHIQLNTRFFPLPV